MKISLILVSTLLVLSVFVPFLIFVYNGSKNTNSTKKQANNIIKNKGFICTLKEVWRHNFMAMVNNNQTLLAITFQTDGNPIINEIDLIDVKSCNIIKQFNSAANKTQTLKSLDLELVYKTPHKQNTILSFFNIDADLTEDFEIQRIEKWQALIQNAIIKPQPIKMAS